MADQLDYESVSAEDRAALTTLCMEYVWRIDHGFALRIPELFSDDGTWEGPWGHLVGKEQLVTGWTERAKNPVRTRHLVTNLRFHRVDDRIAEGWASYIFFVAMPGEQFTSDLDHTGEHLDRYVRTPAGWRFLSRRVAMDR